MKSSQEAGRRGFSHLRIRKDLHFRAEFRGEHVTSARPSATTGTKPQRRLSEDVCWHPEHQGEGCFRAELCLICYDLTLDAEELQSPVVPLEPKNLSSGHNPQLELQAL